MLLNASTVATFFAGVAGKWSEIINPVLCSFPCVATTLQYSVVNFQTKIDVAVNTLWFASLVLSIGSAITGMLAMTWRQAVLYVSSWFGASEDLC